MGLAVFPLNLEKKPFRVGGLNLASYDPNVVMDMFDEYGDKVKYIGVNTGKSGLIVLDLDQKNGKNGFQQLEDKWLIVPETFFYPTENSGEHHVFLSPDGDYYKPQNPYRKMDGVDRRSGGSYVVWYGDVPKRANFTVAPEWLCDKDEVRNPATYDGDLSTWVEELTPGEPSLYVRRAIEKAQDLSDIGHSDMVAMQYNAVRLGAEGHPGVTELFDAIRTLWMNRPESEHSTPVTEWASKFDEALDSAVQKYGRRIELLENLPDFDPNIVPASISDLIFGDSDATNEEWTRALGTLIRSDLDDLQIASTLWHANRTKYLSQEWGIEFVLQRVETARTRPEPTRENPSLEKEVKPENTKAEAQYSGLLTPEERRYISTRPTFADEYIAKAKGLGFVNEKYARTCAWTVASMVFAFRGFLPKSGTDKMGLNLWFMVPGFSGTGKSRAIKTREAILDIIFEGDLQDTSYRLGSDSSPQGLNVALLTRDRHPSLLDVDEAARFFKSIGSSDWMSGLDNTLSHWYEGRVDPSNKLNLKDLKGKSALTSFHIQMFATPDDLLAVLTRDMFKTGFLARFSWALGDPPRNDDTRFIIQQDEEVTDFEYESPEIVDLVLDLWDAADLLGGRPVPILMDDDSRLRISEAYRKMYRGAEGEENWDIIEPSITRLSETIQKVAAINAIYRGSTTIQLCDALNAIGTVEEWYNDLFAIAAKISEGEFQKNCDAIMDYLAAKGRTTHAKLYYSFRNIVKRSRKDLDDLVDFLKTSGRINQVVERGVTSYESNGG